MSNCRKKPFAGAENVDEVHSKFVPIIWLSAQINEQLKLSLFVALLSSSKANQLPFRVLKEMWFSFVPLVLKEVEKFINGLFFGATGGVAELYFVKKSALFNATEPLPISNALGVGMKLKLSLALIWIPKLPKTLDIEVPPPEIKDWYLPPAYNHKKVHHKAE